MKQAIVFLAMAAAIGCEKVDEPASLPASARPAVVPAGVVDLDAPIDPAGLTSAPPAGKVQNIPFTAKHVTIHESGCDTAYELSLFDHAPAAGERLDEVESDRAVTLSFPRSVREGPLSLTKSDQRWKGDAAPRLSYGSPLPGQPERVVQPEPGETALYLTITSWEETAKAADDGRIGRASGRVSIRNSVSRGETGLWIEGAFEAVVVEGPGCLPD